VGHSPFQVAILNNHVNLCIFLVQNGCDINQALNEVSFKEKNDFKDKLSQILVSPQEYETYVNTDTKKFENIKEYIDTVYKMTQKTSFECTIEKNWAGLGYLLLTKGFEMFEALEDCLKQRKYENFMDLIEGLDKKVIQRSNSNN
jgi:hypothetical protein